MIVVCDTSPLNYLILIKADHILPALFGRVVAPPAVIKELRHPKAPDAVRIWSANPPSWLEIETPQTPMTLSHLGPGESEAIAIARELSADTLLIDERDATAAAVQLGLVVVGTLNVLALAASKKLISLPDALRELRQTTFRATDALFAEILRQHNAMSKDDSAD